MKKKNNNRDKLRVGWSRKIDTSKIFKKDKVKKNKKDDENKTKE